MKIKLRIKLSIKLIVILFIFALNACTTVNTHVTQQQQAGLIKKTYFASSNDEKQFQDNIGTLPNNQLMTWQGGENNHTEFSLWITNTYINSQGLPCRNYRLIIDQRFHRKKTIHALACRNDKAQWDSNEDETS